jgi:hypothetical protein
VSDSNVTRQRRIADGLCVECGDTSPTKTCAVCRSVRAEKMRASYNDRIARGVCVDCETLRTLDRRRCDPCLAAARERKKRRDDARLAARGRSAREVTCGRCGDAGHYRTTCTSTVDLAEVSA